MTELLRVRADGAPPILESWLGELRDVLGLEKALAHGLRPEGGGFLLEDMVTSGFSLARERVVAELQPLMGTRTRWGYFDAGRPEPQQRNRPLALGPFLETWRQLCDQPQLLRSRFGLDTAGREALEQSVEESARVYERIGVDDRQHRMRVLVCDGDAFLAYVGAFRSEPFTAAEVRLLGSVTPALVRRLSMDRLLGNAELTHAALTAALEQLAAPAYLLGSNGAVVEVNSLGRSALERSPRELRQRLSEAARGAAEPSGFRIAQLQGPGFPRHVLAIEEGSPAVGPVTDAAAQRWRLTPREREVLVQVALGLPNKAISHALGCSEKTVELHVTRLLRKAEVDSRSALIARLWSQRG